MVTTEHFKAPSDKGTSCRATLVVLVLIAMFPFSAWADPVTWPLSRQKKTVSKAALTQALPCNPSLISHWVEEEGYGKDVRVEYAGYTFVRTDVGDPDGWLTVSREEPFGSRSRSEK